MEMDAEMNSMEESDYERRPQFYIGYHDATRKGSVTKAALDQAGNWNFDMLTTPITNDHFHTRVNALISDHLSGDTVPDLPYLTHLDTDLKPNSVAPSLIAYTSPWIDLCSPDPLIFGISKQILFMEVSFAAFCGITHIFVQGPKLRHKDNDTGKYVLTNNVVQYARVIQESLGVGIRIQISILLPFSDGPDDEENDSLLVSRWQYFDASDEEGFSIKDGLNTWESWNKIRTFCNYHPRLFAALELPRSVSPLYIQSRWFSEPVRALILTSETFTSNQTGWPTMLKTTQDFIKHIMRVKMAPWLLLANVTPIPDLEDSEKQGPVATDFPSSETAQSPALVDEMRIEIKPLESEEDATKPRNDCIDLVNYLRWIERTQPKRSVVERYGAGYQDFLQIPLQPLADNLESLTYEVFEKDPVKYERYYQAMRQALRDWKANQTKTSAGGDYVTVAVVGAGRGPLVNRVLKASKKEHVPVRVWAIEKNPNAFVILQRRNQMEWDDGVELVKSDMRSWKGPSYMLLPESPSEISRSKSAASHSSLPQKVYHKIDILVSELLGSFADNELSPECLDGITRLLSRSHGTSIPRSYTSYITPVAAPIIHADILSRTRADPNLAETPSVVWLHQIDYLSPAPTGSTDEASDPAGQTPSSTPNVMKVWEFKHGPQPREEGSATAGGGTNNHNARFAKVRFRTRARGVMHGLAGYFEAVLYPGVELSTHPITMEEKSADMISWFPILFPLKEPLYLPANTVLDVSMWRQTDGKKVWYEWMVESWAWKLRQLPPGGETEEGGEGEVDAGKQSKAQIKRSKGKARIEDYRMTPLQSTPLHSSVKNPVLL